LIGFQLLITSKKIKLIYGEEVTNMYMEKVLWHCVGDCKKYFTRNPRVSGNVLLCPFCGSERLERISNSDEKLKGI
jgi:rRNA maturation endonuclease Nob1